MRMGVILFSRSLSWESSASCSRNTHCMWGTHCKTRLQGGGHNLSARVQDLGGTAGVQILFPWRVFGYLLVILKLPR